DLKNTDGWKAAQPKDDQLHEKWWELFNDPQLNALEEQINISNQNIAAAAANFQAARAIVREARSQYFPRVTASPAITYSRNPARGGASALPSNARGGTIADFSLPFDASWVPDLWGRVRNTVLSSIYGAQASAADLENTRLIAHAELAVDYLEIRALDAD